jgi:prephenate dehydrogenase
MVGITLGLTHFINITLAKTLSDQDIREVKKFAGTTFAMQLMLAEAVLTEDPNLYYVIESHNPAFRGILDGFLRAAHDLASNLEDRDAFVTTFIEARENLSRDPDFGTVYQRFYKALESSTAQSK